MAGGAAHLMVGRPTGRYKSSTLVVLARRPRSKWWHLFCFGQRGHYHKDGTCAHTDQVLEGLRPDVLARVRVVPFGEGPACCQGTTRGTDCPGPVAMT